MGCSMERSWTMADAKRKMTDGQIGASFGLVIALAFAGLWYALAAKGEIKELRERVETLEARKP
jgi:hypothetical protein